ncbi:MAG: alpha/beta hydrolase [Candidatus Omnitrophota bacterium]
MASFAGTAVLAVITLYIFFRWFERINVWAPTRELIATPEIVGLNYEDVYFAAAEGVRLHGWHIPCESARAALLFCHGNGGNISHRTESMRQLHSLGVHIFIFDYRGYGQSEGRLSEAGTYADALAAYEWLRAKHPDAPIVLFGRSLGANIAADLALKTDAAALIFESGFTSVEELGKEIFPFLPIHFLHTIDYDAQSKIPNIQTPILFIHSPEDDIIPYHHSQKLYAAATAKKERLIIHGGHNDGFILSEAEYLRGIDSFLERVLPAAEQ